MNKIKSLSKWVVIIVLLAMPVVTLAVLPTPTNPIPNNGGIDPSLDTVQQYIETIAGFLITVSLVIAVIMIVIAGIMWMFARGDDEAVKKAKMTLKNGVIGAFIVLAVGLILRLLTNLVQGNFGF